MAPRSLRQASSWTATVLRTLLLPPPTPSGRGWLRGFQPRNSHRHPSAAQEYFEGRIDLTEHLIKEMTSTFIVRVTGQSVEEAGISGGDELIVNRALEPKDGSVGVGGLGGELMLSPSRRS